MKRDQKHPLPSRDCYAPLCGEGGQTIAGELASLAVLGFALAIILATIYTGVSGVRVKHERLFGSTMARSQLELISNAAYSPDPTAVPYPENAPAPGYTSEVTIEYWIAPDGPFTSTVRDDNLQKITVTVSGTSGTIMQLESYKVDR